jgi:hypothetical protein
MKPAHISPSSAHPVVRGFPTPYHFLVRPQRLTRLSPFPYGRHICRSLHGSNAPDLPY